MIQCQWAPLHPDLGFYTHFSNKRNQGSWDKCLVPGWCQGKDKKDKLGYLMGVYKEGCRSQLGILAKAGTL